MTNNLNTLKRNCFLQKMSSNVTGESVDPVKCQVIHIFFFFSAVVSNVVEY